MWPVVCGILTCMCIRTQPVILILVVAITAFLVASEMSPPLPSIDKDTVAEPAVVEPGPVPVVSSMRAVTDHPNEDDAIPVRRSLNMSSQSRQALLRSMTMNR